MADKKLDHFEVLVGDKWVAWQSNEDTSISLNGNKATINMTREVDGQKRKLVMYVDLTGKIIPHVIG